METVVVAIVEAVVEDVEAVMVGAYVLLPSVFSLSTSAVFRFSHDKLRSDMSEVRLFLLLLTIVCFLLRTMTVFGSQSFDIIPEVQKS